MSKAVSYPHCAASVATGGSHRAERAWLFLTTSEGGKAKAVRLGGMPSALLSALGHPADGRLPLSDRGCEALQAALAQHSARQAPT